MLDAIRKFLSGRPDAGRRGRDRGGEATPGDQDLQVAACALLLELAHSDDEFSPEEQLHIEEALARHFDLPAEEARGLIELGESRRRESIDLYQFTSLLRERYDEGQRAVLAEVMWRVVYADGELSRHEEYLLRKIGSLLDLKPGYLAAARKRATAG